MSLESRLDGVYTIVGMVHHIGLYSHLDVTFEKVGTVQAFFEKLNLSMVLPVCSIARLEIQG